VTYGKHRPTVKRVVDGGEVSAPHASLLPYYLGIRQEEEKLTNSETDVSTGAQLRNGKSLVTNCSFCKYML